jgi:VanZ family protein
VVLYAILIFGISSIPYLSTTSSRFELLDKFYHFIEFGVFSFLLFLAFFKSEVKLLNKKPRLFSIFFGMVYAFSDEVHQKFVPGRSADIFDFVADCIGIILVQVILWYYLKSKSRT